MKWEIGLVHLNVVNINHILGARTAALIKINFYISHYLYRNKKLGIPTAPWTVPICVQRLVAKLLSMSGPPESPLHEPWVPTSTPAHNRLFWNKLGKASWMIFLLDSVVSVWVSLQKLIYQVNLQDVKNIKTESNIM